MDCSFPLVVVRLAVQHLSIFFFPAFSSRSNLSGFVPRFPFPRFHFPVPLGLPRQLKTRVACVTFIFVSCQSISCWNLWVVDLFGPGFLHCTSKVFHHGEIKPFSRPTLTACPPRQILVFMPAEEIIVTLFYRMLTVWSSRFRNIPERCVWLLLKNKTLSTFWHAQALYPLWCLALVE